MISAILSISCAYLFGSIPFGLLIARFLSGKDIRKLGSGNIGATNIFRVLGPVPGTVTLLLDMLKGLLPVLIVRAFLPDHHIVHILTGFAAIAGHNWSIFLNFTGGKGVATAAGVFFGLLTGPTAISLVVFILVLLSSQYVSLSSISAAVTLPLAALVFKKPFVIFLFALVIAVLLIIKHKSNIQRLKNGTENKFNVLKWLKKNRKKSI